MINYFDNLISDIGINDIVDIVIVTFVVYKVLGFIRESRAEQLVKGLIILTLATLLSDIFNLHTLNWLLKTGMTLGVIALVVVFQPELRRALEYMGRSKIIKTTLNQVTQKEAYEIIGQIREAVEELAKNKTGALIVMERQTALTDICETGTNLDSKISKELLTNIFYDGSPLHDGAVILRGDRIHSAGCVLPLTRNSRLSKDLGTRHRAGIGITENSDCITIMVSEETGIVSVAKDGILERYFNGSNIEKLLRELYMNPETGGGILGGIKNAVNKFGGDRDVSK